MSMLSEMGINIIEDEEAEEEEAKVDRLCHDGPRVKLRARPETEKLDRTDDPVRMYLREMGSVELLSPRGRDCHRQADRSWPQHDDPGPLRKPADFQAITIWRDELADRRHSAARCD